MSTFLYSTVTVSDPVARLNPGNDRPFAAVELDGAWLTITMHTPAEARALAAAFEAAASLLEEHVAQTGPEVTP